MYRVEGPIPELKNSRYPHSILVFDTEAYRGEIINGVEAQTLRLGVCKYLKVSKDLEVTKEETQVFYSVNDLYTMIDWYSRKDSSIYIYAHNIKYDIQLSGILTYMLGEGWKISIIVLDDPPTFIRLKRGRKSVMFVDTFNYWQTSVKAMGDQLGSAKLTMPEGKDTDEEMIIYCTRDVEILTQYLLTFMRYLDDNDLAGLGLTLASQSFRSYRHRFMKTPIVIHKREEVLQLERDGYMGGRVEAYFIGTAPSQPYYKLDVNSMYPYVMKSHTYPIELVGYSENIMPGRLWDLLEEYYVIADCTLKTDKPIYAYKNGHKLVYPVGEFRTVLHHTELLDRMNLRARDKIHRVAIYRQGDVFSSYVNYLYERKLKAEAEGNKVERHQAKILLNSLYGKFGQREFISTIQDNPEGVRYGRLTGYSEALGKTVEVMYLGDQIEIRYQGGESIYSCPSIAGAVTAYARRYLWGLIELAGFNNTYYCDTDSLIVNEQGYKNLTSEIDPTRLGKLKLEGVETSLVIQGAKEYIYGTEVKHKGVPHNAKEITLGVWEYQQFRGAKTWALAGMPTGVEVYTRTKTRKTRYDKGTILDNGKVIPLSL